MDHHWHYQYQRASCHTVLCKFQLLKIAHKTNPSLSQFQPRFFLLAQMTNATADAKHTTL